MECYLDNAATTKPLKEVIQIMTKTMEEDYANPSSLHRKGFEAEQYIREAREQIAKTLKATKSEIIFTSGGTEANNQAIFSAAETRKRYGNHIVTTSIEHPSVYQPFEKLKKDGFEVAYLPVDAFGRIDEEAFKKTIRKDTILLSMMLVNNVIGSVNDIKKLVQLARQINPDILVHVDAIQAYGKVEVNTKTLDVNFLSVSGHKIHGPKGVGFLYVKSDTRLLPYIYGGGQQKNMRSGTENVPAVAGLGVAAAFVHEDFEAKIEKLYSLKERLVKGVLEALPSSEVNGIRKDLPLSEALREMTSQIVNISFPGIKSEVLLHSLEEKDIFVSSGSACSAKNPGAGGVLKEIGLDKERAIASIRFSFSLFTTEEMIDRTVLALKELVPVLSKYRRR